MKRFFFVSLPLSLLMLSSPLRAQPRPLPTLPPPATDAAPSTLNAAPAPPSSPAVTAPAPPAAAPLAPPFPPPPPPPMDVTAGSPTYTRVAAPPVPPEPEPPAPIAVSGPGTFTHDGFYMRLSVGGGGMSVWGSGPRGSTSTSGGAGTFALAIGGTPSRGLVVGGIIAGSALGTSDWSNNGVGVATNATANSLFGGFADWYPNERRGWHVGGALGLGVLTVSPTVGDSYGAVSLGGRGFGGYDFWIGPQWSLGLQGELNFTSGGALKDNNSNDTGYSLGSFGASVEVALVYH